MAAIPTSTRKRGSGPLWTLGYALALAMIVAVSFAPTLFNGWVDWDDDQNYLHNQGYRGLGSSQLWWDCTAYHVGVYQPVGWMISGAEYLLIGMDVRGYHLASIVMHAAVAVMLWRVMRSIVARCLPDLWAESPGSVGAGAFLAAALFASHPMRAEVVAWASCQQYLPSAFVSLLAVLAYLRAHPKGRRGSRSWLFAAWVVMRVAMLS